MGIGVFCVDMVTTAIGVDGAVVSPSYTVTVSFLHRDMLPRVRAIRAGALITEPGEDVKSVQYLQSSDLNKHSHEWADKLRWLAT